MIDYEKTERLQQFLTGGFTAAELRRNGPLRDSEAAWLADEALCKALNTNDQNVMLAAAHLAVDTHWYTPSVLAALARRQPKQLNNTEFQERYSQIERAADGWFPVESLPLRQAATRHAQAWSVLISDQLNLQCGRPS
jgi:hypothetical protein